MDWSAYLDNNPAFLIASSFVLSLAVGSFLNVVIHRLPIMMYREWRAECRTLLKPDDGGTAETSGGELAPDFNLVRPRSRCPACGHPISALENIPVLSYIVLRGRCRSCRKPISLRYPIVELLTGTLTAVVVWHFGWQPMSLAAALFTWALIAGSAIDLDEQLLPDSIVLPLLWLGLLVNLAGVGPTDLASAVIGATAGYLSLWSIYWLFKWATGKEGMGYGDFKLLAALGAWLGWQQLPLIVLISAGVGAVTGVALILFRQHGRGVPIPFGPFLAAAGWISLLWGEEIARAYLRMSGI